jgi:Uma2 family endonuclease
MVVGKEYVPKLTPAEYLAWEEQQVLRHEYVNGEVLAMTGGTLNHSQIAGNFTTILNVHLRGSGCRVLTSDAKVSIQASDDYIYPDISVTCDEADKNATQSISYPCLIIEVLSPSTEARDRWEKFNLYRRSDRLQDYVLVDTHKIEIALYSKNELGKWEIIRYTQGDIVELKSIHLAFPIEQVFEGIFFNAELKS